MDTSSPTDASQEASPTPLGESVARKWASLGHEVTLQGTVVRRAASRTVALYTGLAAPISLIGIHRPRLALVLLLLIGLSALIDLDGGRGWLRGLRAGQPAHNVVIWPAEAHGPLLLVAAPMDATVPLRRLPAWVLRIPLSLLGLAILGCCLMHRMSDVGHATLLTAAICLALVSVVSLCWRWLADSQPSANPARAAIELAIAQVDRAKLQNLRCAFALIGGDCTHYDGLETLLLNHRHRLRRDATRVLLLEPDQEILGAVHHEGRIRRSPSDALLVNSLRELGLAGRTRTTGASRARRAGWRAAAMTVGPDQVHAAAGILTKLAQQLDAGLDQPQEGG